MRRQIAIKLIFALLLLAATGHWYSAEADRPAPVTVKLTPKQEAAAARALRERLLSDPHRPGYHFVIPEGTGMPFDPNGAIFWNGRYHMFYIFQDERGHNWGHVSSTDLCHWRHHPTKLVNGMFSGNCFVNKDGVPTMCYHQVGQGNAMAVALDDNLDDWKKIDSNPITPKTKPGDPHHGKYQSWDPYGWLEDETYYAIFGGKRAAIARAPSLDGPWEYRGDLLARPAEGVDINEDISCADFFKLDGRHVLLCISHDLGARYYLGEWLDEQFSPTHHEQMSWVDNSFFAPESLLDDRGRRIMWAWAKDRPDFKIKDDQHWSGTMSLPRVLSLAPDGTMRMQVPQEFERLRYNPKKQENIEVDGEVQLDIQGDSLELRVLIDPGTAKECGVKVRCSPDGKEETLIYYDTQEKKLKIDTTNSSLKSDIKAIEGGPFELHQGELLTLRIFIDKSIVEVFANDRQAVMRRIYPSRDDSVDVKIFARGGTCKALLVEGWDMMPSNPH